MKRRIFLLAAFLMVLLCIGCAQKGTEGKVSIFSRPTVERTPGKRKDWNDVSSFVCYYGEFDIEFQSKFDVVIMHSTVLYFEIC